MSYEECDRCTEPTDGKHSCPYEAEVNGNHDEDYCNCCKDCMRDCEDA